MPKKTLSKNTDEKEKTKAVKVKYVCRNCRDKKMAMMEMHRCLHYIGLKSMQCFQCKKWGQYMAAMIIDEKEICWAVIDYTFDKKTKKIIIVDEAANDSIRIKKKIYGNLPKSELDSKQPFRGINNPKNHCIAGDKMVDSELNLIEPKWSKEFKETYKKELMVDTI